MKGKGTADECCSPFVGPDDENQKQKRCGGFAAPFKCKKNNNKEKTQGERRGGLVTLAGAWRVVDPVEDDEWQAANHEDDSHD